MCVCVCEKLSRKKFVVPVVVSRAILFFKIFVQRFFSGKKAGREANSTLVSFSF